MMWKTGVMVGENGICVSDQHLINYLQKQPLHQSKAMPAHISTKPDPSNITGHKVLIFHSSEYRLAINRIYTRLSMFQGGLPSLCSAGSSSPLHIWNLPSSSSSCVCLPERGVMEIDKNETCDSSNLDKNKEQQRWVWGYFNFFFPTWSFKMNCLYYVLLVLL